MKYLVILFLCLGFGNSEKLEIIRCTSQEWAGGLRESGYGINYELTLKTKAASGQLSIGDLWIGDTRLKVRVIADPSNLQNKAFAKGSQLILKAGITYRPDAQGKITDSVTDSIKKPFNFKGEGLLVYTYKGHKSYLKIAEFKKLEKIIYP
jgi:hypothetical protein